MIGRQLYQIYKDMALSSKLN